MPASLSEANQRYNQMKRIHPKNPVSKLDYYLASEPISCSSSTSNSSPLASDTVSSSNSAGEKYHGSADGSDVDSYYNTALNRALRARKRETRIIMASEIPCYVDRPKQQPQSRSRQGINNQSSKKLAGSPLDTSGFSEGTIVEASFRKSIGNSARPSTELGNPNWSRNGGMWQNVVDNASNSQHKYAKQNQRLEPEVGGQRRASSGAISKQNMMRLRRNRNNRFNRKHLLDGSDHLVNPYALSELFSQSEIPGFREIFASDSYLRKFCWIVAFLFMTVLSLNDMTELITEYFEYPITVDVRLRDSSRLPFPSVTVCNLNVVRFSALCSSTPSTRLDLTSQIPSGLRDKLCGIQVDKKNTTADSDISDINNIGITTTTTTTSTTTTTTTTTASTAMPSDTSTSGSTTIDDGLKPEENSDLNSKLGGGHRGTTIDQTPGTLDLTSPRSSGGHPIEHRTTRMPETGRESSTRRSTANGGLDLGDFADRTLLFSGRSLAQKRRRQPSSKSDHQKRSIRFTDTEFESDPQPRPFASSKWKVRIRPASELATPEASGARHNSASQSAQLTTNTNGDTTRAGSVGRPATSQIRTGPTPGGQSPNTVNSHQNPLNLGAPPPQQSTTTPVPATSTVTFVPPTLPEDFELTERQERELQENLTNWLAVMYNRDPRLTWSLGHQFDDMILRCTMKSVNCTHQRSFENSFTPTEGNCFTYRSRIKRRTIRGSHGNVMFDEANLAGTNHGLELVLNLEKNEYVSGSSQVGALVMIHHPSDLGYAASEATFVAPEFTTYIGLKMVNITRLPAPYPEYCIDSWPAKFADTLTRNSTYSQQACLKICLQKTIQSHCQCQSAFLPIVELDSNSAGVSSSGQMGQAGNVTMDGSGKPQQNEQRIIICDTRKLATRHCVREVMFRAADRVHNCECPPKCQVIRYDKTISMARWPTREDKVTFDRGKMDVNFQNLAKVIVYFQTMTCEEVTQQAVFNAAKLFSAVGGIMGMYVGFSFLSVFEIFEVMSRKMWHHFTSKLANTTSSVLSIFRS